MVYNVFVKSYKLSIEEQREIFLKIILKNPVIKSVLDGGFVEGIKDWYLVAGCLNQTVWNYNTKRPIDENISDYDLIYFDRDTSYEAEDKIIKAFNKKYEYLSAKFDIKNQARVHLWIKEKWGIEMKPLLSCEDAISSWPVTVACVGVRKNDSNFVITAPYGLTDNLEMIIRPNKLTVMRAQDYNSKLEKWKKRWPTLTVIPW